MDDGGAIAAICDGLVNDPSGLKGCCVARLLTLANDGFDTVVFVVCVVILHTD